MIMEYNPSAPPPPAPPVTGFAAPPQHQYATSPYYPPANSGSWTTGLCGCAEDCSVCWCAWCCPCVLVGRYANILDQGATSPFVGGALFCIVQFLTGCGCLYSCMYRGKLRHKYALPEDPCNDICTECCCNCCSIAQVYRELKNRNINPAHGYDVVRPVYEQPPQVQHMHKTY